MKANVNVSTMPDTIPDTILVTVPNGNMSLNKMGRSNVEQARSIKNSLGVYTAARYLALRGWSLEASMYILLGK